MEEVKVKENTEKENTENVGKPTSKHWAIIGIAAVLIVLAGAMIFIFGGSSAKKLQKQLDLGQKYLEEMNYEEAVVAFQAAIEIDPMSVDAYLGLVEVYIRTGEFDTALEYARNGYEATGAERLKEKMEMIESENKARELQKQLDLGQQYLEEMNYEEAAAAFEAAIEIDPMNVDAYLGLVEVYIRTGEFDTALEYAKKGYEVTGDERLKEKIDMIKSGNITASNGWKMQESYYDADGSLFYYLLYQYGEQGVGWTSLFWADGSLIDEGKCLYNEKGDPIVSYSLGYDFEGRPHLEKIENEYDSKGNMISYKFYDGNGILSDHVEFEYDSEGNEIAMRSYNGDGTLYDYSEYEYDSKGNEIGWNYYDGDGILRDYSESEYNIDGNLIVERYYDGHGISKGYDEYEYDAKGNMIGHKSYLNDGTSYENQREYDADGNLIAERYYDSDGNLYSYDEYEYDAKGYMTCCKHYDDGILRSYTEWEYDTDGNMIVERNYDGDGTLTSETRYD